MVVTTLQSFAPLETDSRPAEWNRHVDRLTFRGSSFFRLRLVLALIFQRPIRITDIRKPGTIKNSIANDLIGLADYEVSLLELLEKFTDGGKIFIDKSGTQVNFYPGQIVGGTETGDPLIHNCGTSRNLAYFLEALVLICPFARRPVFVRLRGATHGGGVRGSPDTSVDHLMGVLVPLLRQVGLPGDSTTGMPLNIKILRKGFAPGGGGEVELSCGITRVIKPFRLLSLGRVKRVRGRAFVCGHKALCHGAIRQARGVLNEFLPDVWIFDSAARSGVDGTTSHGYSVTMLAETMKGAVIGCSIALGEEELRSSESADAHTETVATARATLQQRLQMESKMQSSVPEFTQSEEAGKLVAQRLLAEICLAGAVDTTFQHIPLVFMAIADETGPSEICLGRLTPYSVAVLRHLNDFCQSIFVFKEQEGSEIEENFFHRQMLKRILLRCVGVGVRNIHKKTF